MGSLLQDISNLPDQVRNGAVAIGNFDGVHQGHRELIRRVRQLASRIHGPSIIFTFDPPPARLLRPESAPASLTWIERRAMLLSSLGIDYVVSYPTTLELLSLEPEAFFEQILIDKLGAKAIIEGSNFRFGRNRRGDVALMERLCIERSMKFELVEPQTDSEDWISSSRIRLAIETGDIAQANRWLVEPYRLRGVVATGAARGRTLGFPTANLDAISVLVPCHGVYAGRVTGFDRPEATQSASPSPNPTDHAIAVNIGPNPTFGEHASKVEVHIIGFAGDLYGGILEIELLSHLRAVQKFASKEELLAQLEKDIASAKQAGQ